MQSVDPTKEITVTLPASEWNQVIHLMIHAPVAYVVSAPTIQRVMGQVTKGAEEPTDVSK